MKLHYAQNSRAVRVAWLLEELKLSYTIEKYQVGDRFLRQPEYKKIHPLGRIPVLEDNDITIFESGAIIEYILAKYGNGKLRPNFTDPNFSDYLQWFHFSEGMLMPPMNTIVVETVLLGPDRRNQTNIDRARKLLGVILDTVNERLSVQNYLAGQFSAADIMTGHAVIMAAKSGADLSNKVNLLEYTERLMNRPSLKTAWSL